MDTKTSLLHSPWTQKPLSCTPHGHKNLSPALPMNTKTSLLHSPWTQKPLSCTPHGHKNLSPALPINTKTSLLHSPWTQKPLSCTPHEHKNLSPALPMDTKMSSHYFPCHQTGLLGNSYAFRQWWEPFNVSLWGTVTRQCPQTTTFEEEREPKWIRTEVPLLTSLTPYR